jgi:Fur family peroxide stress response transcriptional regulator
MNDQDRLQKLINLSRERGLKLTPQRMVIFRILSKADQHLTVDEVYQKAKEEHPMLSAATVYRNMEQMVKTGLLSYLGRSGNAMRYDTNLDEHHHFVCDGCGKVDDVYLKKVNYELDVERSPLAEVRIDAAELYLHGVCKDCLKGS